MTDEQKPERGESKYWLDLIEKAEKDLSSWQTAADNLEKVYANLDDLRRKSDSEFQLFWSNIQVMGPSIYARPPVPVVTPKFKDRRPLYRTASEMLERACAVSFDLSDIDETMIALRDDLVLSGRGVSWVRYESDDSGEKVCYEHVDRKDFLHDPARKWSEVDWGARRAWLTRDEMRERFDEAADEVEYQSRNNDPGASSVEKCGVWEIWCKSENKVVWVTEGCENTLDENEPHLKLAGFFPFPKPAFATLQPRSLIPVPDMLFYKAQLDEVNDLTNRIHALADAIKVRGFYAGSGDIGEAIERAINLVDDEQVLVPVPAMAALMQGGGDPIVWLPLDMIAQTITGLIELRRQVIDDVYQIIGLSDIMRGATEASETLGAQQLKQQNGSYRVRDKQNELVRVARDLVRIGAEIMSEEFDSDTLVEMAQMDLPTDADVRKHIGELEAAAHEEITGLTTQAQEAIQSGQVENPQEAQQQFEAKQQEIVAKWDQQLTEAGKAVTIDAVTEFLKDEKLRPFALDIETDSTVYPDEMAEKQSRQEFMGAFANSMQSLIPMFQMGPEAISVAGGVFKFALAPYRVGRELEGLIDDFVDQAPQIAQQMQAEGGGDDLADAQMKLAEAEFAKVQSQTQANEATAALKGQELQLKAQEFMAKTEEAQQKFALEVKQTQGSIAETEARIEKVYAEIQKLGVDAGNQTRTQDREDARAASDIEGKQFDRSMTVHDKQRAIVEGERSNARADRDEARQDMQMNQKDSANEQG